jgi:cytochrome P450
MLMAGHETTAKSLTWTLWLLGQHPDIAKRAQAEVDSVLSGDVPGADAFERLPFLKAVFNEGLRLYPPVWLMSRRAVDDDTLGEFEIPKDSLVCISPWLLHRRNDLWEDADQFRPERFMINSDRHPCAFLPFSAGPRQCIGQHFASLEGVIILARILQKVDIHIDFDHLVEPEALVTLRPRHGVLANIRARTGQ